MKNYLLLFSTFLLIKTALYGTLLDTSSSQSSLIVYNSNVGLVHETRKLQLTKDETHIVYEDVASSINTDSVNVSLPQGVSLYSQQYRYDKLTQAKLLNAHIGKKIQVKVREDMKTFNIIDAVLLSNDGKLSVVKHKNSIIIVQSKGIIFKSIPKELITKPSLVWNVKTKKNINDTLDIDYLINNISWKSNYILNLDGNEADLMGWISINNNSGKSFKDTTLHVLAGEINRAQKPRRNYRVAKAVMMSDSMPEVSHQAHEGYHFYTIPFQVTLANNENTQLKFLTQHAIPVKRKYTVRVNNPNYLQGEIAHDVVQFITMQGLDLPLPSGVVRTYSELGQTNILLGETLIKHTPKDTPLSLKLGKNFDVKVKETLLKHDKGSWNLDVDVKYTLKNSSDEVKNITLQVPFNKRDGSKVKSDLKYTFTKGNMVTFVVEVPANSEKSFNAYYTTTVTD